MSIYKYKSQFQKLASLCETRGLSPNLASILGWFFAMTNATFLYLGIINLHAQTLSRTFLLLVPFSTLFRLIFNALDGMIARQRNQATPMGELLNELGDVWGDTISYGILFFVPGITKLTVFIYILMIWFAEFTAVLGRALPGQIRRQEAFLGGKSERAIWFILYSLCLAINPDTLYLTNQFLIALSFFVLVTAFIRIYKIKKETANKPYQSKTLYGK